MTNSWLLVGPPSISRELLSKCKKVEGSLEWGEGNKYFENLPVHWSPWLSKLGLLLESPKWREVAKKSIKKFLCT